MAYRDRRQFHDIVLYKEYDGIGKNDQRKRKNHGKYKKYGKEAGFQADLEPGLDISVLKKYFIHPADKDGRSL